MKVQIWRQSLRTRWDQTFVKREFFSKIDEYFISLQQWASPRRVYKEVDISRENRGMGQNIFRLRRARPTSFHHFRHCALLVLSHLQINNGPPFSQCLLSNTLLILEFYCEKTSPGFDVNVIICVCKHTVWVIWKVLSKSLL